MSANGIWGMVELEVEIGKLKRMYIEAALSDAASEYACNVFGPRTTQKNLAVPSAFPTRTSNPELAHSNSGRNSMLQSFDWVHLKSAMSFKATRWRCSTK